MRSRELQTTFAKPFVKWVGGKSQLLPEIDAAIAQHVSGKEAVTYVEPFIGGGAVLFHVLRKFPQVKIAVINDQFFSQAWVSRIVNAAWKVGG